jgi:hypothetical protein
LAHAELCVSPAFIRAVDASLLQYIEDLPSPKDAHTNICNSSMIEGARGVLKTLMTLADKMEPRKPMPSGNLPGNVRP